MRRLDTRTESDALNFEANIEINPSAEDRSRHNIKCHSEHSVINIYESKELENRQPEEDEYQHSYMSDSRKCQNSSLSNL